MPEREDALSGEPIASNLRIVTLLIAPASRNAARSPRKDSMILLVTTNLQ